MLDNAQPRSVSVQPGARHHWRGAEPLAVEVGPSRRPSRGCRGRGADPRGRLRHRAGPVQPRVGVGGARSAARGAGRVGLLVPAPAPAPPGQRRPGGALSRRTRTVAAGHAPERGGGQPRRPPRVGGAGAACRGTGGRGVLADRRVAPRGAGAAARLRRQPGGRGRGRARGGADRPRVHPPGAQRDVHGQRAWRRRCRTPSR